MWLVTMFLVPVALLTAGVSLVVFGVRGKLRGTGSYCRGCGFSLAGLIENDPYVKCPECGRPLSLAGAVRRGQRVVRRWVLVSGVVLMAASLPSLARMVRMDFSSIEGLTPDSVLVSEAVMDRLDYKQNAELFKRVSKGTLSPGAAKELAATLLEGQRTATLDLSVRRLVWLELLRVSMPGAVSDEQWRAYARGVSSPLSARVTPKGETADVRLVWNEPRSALSSSLVHAMSVTGVRVGEEDVPVAGGGRAIRLDLSPNDYEAFTEFKIPWPGSGAGGPVTITWMRTVTDGGTVVDAWEETVRVEGTGAGR